MTQMASTNVIHHIDKVNESFIVVLHILIHCQQKADIVCSQLRLSENVHRLHFEAVCKLIHVGDYFLQPSYFLLSK